MIKIGSQAGRDDTSESSRPGSSPRRILFLLLLFGLVLAAWPLSRLWLGRSIPHPLPATADVQSRVRYYLSREKADPSDRPAYVELGRLYEGAGYYMAALDQLEIARALGAPDAQTARLMGRCDMRLGRIEPGRAEMERAVRAQPDNVDAALDIAVVYYEAARSDDALRTLQFYLQHHPQLLRAPTVTMREPIEKLMNAFTQIGDLKTGTELAKNLIAVAPSEPDGYAVAGRNLLALNKPDDAAGMLQTAVRLAPEVGAVHYLYGMALSRLKGQRSAALLQWQEAVAKSEHAPAYGEIGSEYARQKDWRRAAIAYWHMGEIESDDPRPYQLSAEAWTRAGDRDRARYCRGKASLLLGHFPEALADFEQLATADNPEIRQRGIDGCVETYRLVPARRKECLKFVLNARFRSPSEQAIRIADAYGEMKNFGKRKEYLELALKRDPALSGHVLHELGKIAETNGYRDLAEQQYKAAIAAAPNDASCHRSLCLLYLDRRDLGDRLRLAVKEAEQVVKLNPGEASDEYQLGVARAAAGDYPGAVLALQHAIDLQPGYGPPYLDLGQIAQKMGNSQRADELFKLYRKYQAYDLRKQTLTTRARTNRQDAAAQVALAEFCERARDFRQAAFFYARALRVRPQDRATRASLNRMYSLLGRVDEQQQDIHPEGTSGVLHP